MPLDGGWWETTGRLGWKWSNTRYIERVCLSIWQCKYFCSFVHMSTALTCGCWGESVRPIIGIFSHRKSQKTNELVLEWSELWHQSFVLTTIATLSVCQPESLFSGIWGHGDSICLGRYVKPYGLYVFLLSAKYDNPNTTQLSLRARTCPSVQRCFQHFVPSLKQLYSICKTYCPQ